MTSLNYSSNIRRMSGTLDNKGRSATRSGDEGRVKVAVRCRPMSDKEINYGHKPIVEIESPNKIIVHDPSESPSDQLGTKSGERRNYSHVYEFDAIFDSNSSQKDVYNQSCRPIVDSVLEGYNGTIFAYGQTGTGKTYTMDGMGCWQRPRSSAKLPTADKQQSLSAQYSKIGKTNANRRSSANIVDELRDENSIGIIPRAFKQIFDYVASNTKTQFLIRASYLEIYQEDIHDLLRKDRTIKLELHERPDVGVYVKDLTSFVCKSIGEIERIMRIGNQNRIVGATDMNEHSSRSHAIFMITVEQQSTLSNDRQHEEDSTRVHGKGKEKSAPHVSQRRVIRVGKLNLVDLAGSERQRKTNSFGQRQRESIKINLSLSALGNVINSLMKIHTQQEQQSNTLNASGVSSTSQAGFTPYRDSKLTRLLQDSLGGNAKTLMIANIGPASYNYDETINTLNYASRAKCIRNRPKLNEDPKDALLRELQLEIDDLRSKLASMSSAGGASEQANRGGSRKVSSRSSASHANVSKDSNESGDQKTILSAASKNDLIERELLDLKEKLSSLESKLLNGVNQGDGGYSLDQNLLQGYTHEQELELERSRAELADQVNRERSIRDELERREEAELIALESFSSIQQEVEAKRRLVRKILLKVKLMRDQNESTQRAYRLELEELDQLQYVLQKELKLKCLIMDNFIPNNHVDQLLPRIEYDEKRNLCTVEPIELPTTHCRLTNSDTIELHNRQNESLRVRSEFERICEAIYPGNIRYKCENLIEPKLEQPRLSRTKTLVLEENGQERSSNLQTLVDQVFSQREADIVI